jgi:hypothetical protein
MTERHRVLPFPVSPQLDTSDLVIGVSLDDLVDGITAAATGLPAPPVRTVATRSNWCGERSRGLRTTVPPPHPLIKLRQ